MANADDTGWNRRAGPVFKYGLATGFVLLLLGGLSLGLTLTNAFLEMLVVCAGLGIILGAFGSTASVKIPVQGLTLAGVAAIAVALFIVLLAQLDDRYVRVKLGGDIEDAAVEFVGDQNYLGAYRDAHRTHDFIVFGKEIKRKRLNLFITLSNDREFHFKCINPNTLRPHLATGGTIEWSFQLPPGDGGQPSIIDVESGSSIAEGVGDCRIQPGRDTNSVSNGVLPSIASVFGFLQSAFAQSGATDRQIRSLLKRLESGTSYVRRNARSELAAVGLPVVKPLLEVLSSESASYRLKLGAIVALTEMMRANKNRRREVIAMVGTDDLRRLIDAATGDDRTMRAYASEFLFDLGDPRAIPLAFGRMRSVSEGGRYNLLLAVKGAVPFIAGRDQRARVIRQAVAQKSADTPKINQLIESIEKLAN